MIITEVGKQYLLTQGSSGRVRDRLIAYVSINWT